MKDHKVAIASRHAVGEGVDKVIRHPLWPNARRAYHNEHRLLGVGQSPGWLGRKKGDFERKIKEK